MFRIEEADNSIYLTKGDTGIIQLTITKKDGSAYVPFADDIITLSLKKIFEEEKVYTVNADGEKITISAEDSAKIAPGKYVYDIQIKQFTGCTQTFFSGYFYVMDEVTQ